MWDNSHWQPTNWGTLPLTLIEMIFHMQIGTHIDLIFNVCDWKRNPLQDSFIFLLTVLNSLGNI